MPKMHILKRLHEGMTILMEQKEETIDWSDSGYHVIHQTAMFTSEPEHSNECYFSFLLSEQLSPPLHQKLLDLGWSYEYPYYCLYDR